MTKIRFTRAAILARVQHGPAKLLELAQGSNNHQVRQRLMRHIDALVAEGAIKKLWLSGFPHYVSADFEVTDEMRVQMLLDNCRPVDGCMVWTGHVDPSRGPIGRADAQPVSVRRFIWRVKRGELPHSIAVRMRDDCEHGCVEYGHMRAAPRNEAAVGRPVSPSHRQAMALAVRARIGKLDWAKVRAIRSSEETNKVLALRLGVSASLVGQVRRHEIWVEAGGLFTGLLERAAA